VLRQEIPYSTRSAAPHPLRPSPATSHGHAAGSRPLRLAPAAPGSASADHPGAPRPGCSHAVHTPPPAHTVPRRATVPPLQELLHMHQTERDESPDQLDRRIQFKPLVVRPIHRLHLTQTLRLLALTYRATLPPQPIGRVETTMLSKYRS
jgi:hypothetical protein